MSHDAKVEPPPEKPRQQFDLKLLMLVVAGVGVVLAIGRNDTKHGITAALVMIAVMHWICRKRYPGLLDVGEPVRSIIEQIAAMVVGAVEGAILGVAALLVRALIVSRIDSVVEFLAAGAVVGVVVGVLFPRFVLRYMFPL